MPVNRREALGNALMLVAGIGLVFGAIYFILAVNTQAIWTPVSQLPFGIVAVASGLFLYGEAVWRLAKQARANAP